MSVTMRQYAKKGGVSVTPEMGFAVRIELKSCRRFCSF